MNNNLVSSTIFDILSLRKIPTTTIQYLWNIHCENKLEESIDILVEEIQQGDFSRVDDDDKISLLHRYAQAAMNGAARINLRLLAKAINSLAQNEKLASPIYANEFNRYATVLETLSDEEIQFLASMILSHLLCHLAVSFSRSLVKIKKNSSLFQRAIHMVGWGERANCEMKLFIWFEGSLVVFMS